MCSPWICIAVSVIFIYFVPINPFYQQSSFFIHQYLRQFRYSYWWRARHVGVYKPLFITSKKCWNMGVTCELAPVSSYYWSRATAGTVVPHHAWHAQHSLIRSCLPEVGGGPYHFIAGGVLWWKKSLNNYNFSFILLFDQKCWCLLIWPKRYLWMGFKGVVLKPPRPPRPLDVRPVFEECPNSEFIKCRFTAE